MKNVLNNDEGKILTAREKEVLEYVIDGLHNKEIAQKLGISAHTVKAHVSSILNKSGVKNRVLLVKTAVLKKMKSNVNDMINLKNRTNNKKNSEK